MRALSGPTDRVVVIGAGLAGLSAALHLAGAGREVLVVERASGPGGRCGRLSVAGYHFDTGPTVLTMPEFIDATFAAVGESISDRLPLRRLDPAYRARFADGSTLDVHAEIGATAAHIEEVAGAGDAAGFVRLVDWLRELYVLEMPNFIARNLDSPRQLLGPALAQLVARGGFRSLQAKVNSFVRDDRLRRLFTFQALYAGLAPHDARALFGVITYMDCVNGVFHPDGGMYALPVALAEAAADHGVQFRYDTTITHIETWAGRARAVRTGDGERIPADGVIA
ncbi:MAG: phytoene desaturase, partial [Actinobacteria bacterium]|nr:phytoene desaturase [Actinomycetota bacterium]